MPSDRALEEDAAEDQDDRPQRRPAQVDVGTKHAFPREALPLSIGDLDERVEDLEDQRIPVVALTAGLCLNAVHSHDGPLISALADTTNVLIELSKFGLALLILAALAAAPGPLGNRTVAWGAVAVALLLVSALPPFLAATGIWQFGGGPEVIASLPAAAWVLWLSLRLVRHPEPPPEMAAQRR